MPVDRVKEKYNICKGIVRQSMGVMFYLNANKVFIMFTEHRYIHNL